MVVNPDGSVNFEGAASPYQTGGARAVAPGADLAAANRAARVTKYGSDMVGKMEAAGSTFGGPAAPSVSTATNVAPGATSAAASTPNFGQRALKLLRSGGGKMGSLARGVGAALLVPNMALSAMKTAETPTEDYEKRFGFGVSNIESPALRGVRDVGVRALGALTDLGNQFNPFSSTGTRAAAPANATSTVPAAATTIPGGVNAYSSVARAPAEVQRLATGAQPIPSEGTGMAVNSRTGRVMSFNTGVPAAAGAGAYAQPGYAPQPENRLKLNTGQDVIDLAYAARDRRRAVEAGQIGVKNLEAQARILGSTGQYMRGAAAMANTGTAGLKVAPDALGNQQIIDLKTGTTTTPKKLLPESDIQAMMKKYSKTRDQIVQEGIAQGYATK